MYSQKSASQGGYWITILFQLIKLHLTFNLMIYITQLCFIQTTDKNCKLKHKLCDFVYLWRCLSLRHLENEHSIGSNQDSTKPNTVLSFSTSKIASNRFPFATNRHMAMISFLINGKIKAKSNSMAAWIDIHMCNALSEEHSWLLTIYHVTSSHSAYKSLKY